MNDFVIFTDSACDIKPETLKDWGVGLAELTFKFSGEDTEYKNSELTPKEIFDKMREGATGKTAAINIETFKDVFREELKEGRDVLYLAFSSGLSNTYNAGRLAAEELLEEFPDRRVIAVDTLSASAGEGLFVYLAVEKKKAGATIEEIARWALENRMNLCHWFSVDELKYLKRGGRISPTAAFVGGMLSIKPVLHVDDEGHLINVAKVRGRRAALSELCKKYGELALDKAGTVFISHADCMDDVESVKKVLSDEYGAKVELVTDIGPVIGLHAGPGTIAVFFLGKNR